MITKCNCSCCTRRDSEIFQPLSTLHEITNDKILENLFKEKNAWIETQAGMISNITLEINVLKQRLKDAEELIGDLKSELYWARALTKDKLKFGLPEDIAIKRRESNVNSVLSTSLNKINEYFNKHWGCL